MRFAKFVGLNLKDCGMWNKTAITKHVWYLTERPDSTSVNGYTIIISGKMMFSSMPLVIMLVGIG